MMETIQQYVLPHWPFFSVAIVLMLVGQVMKSSVWTRKRAHTKGKMQWMWWWMYKTMPIHPVVAGTGIGLLWHNPEGADPGWPLIAGVMYFALAGTISVWLYQILKGLAKKRGVDLGNLPGQSSAPPAPKGDK
jgi:hypothetical protein